LPSFFFREIANIKEQKAKIQSKKQKDKWGRRVANATCGNSRVGKDVLKTDQQAAALG
jgi:hypothetical protein